MYALFQSTRPRGARPFLGEAWIVIKRVSIHAPARGATWESRSESSIFVLFQSTRPRGARRGTI